MSRPNDVNPGYEIMHLDFSAGPLLCIRQTVELEGFLIINIASHYPNSFLAKTPNEIGCWHIKTKEV